MGRFAMKNVCQKQGRTYFRRKVAGRDEYIRLPDPSSPDFAEEYARLSRPEKLRSKALAGTLGALVAEYRASSEYQLIKSDKTRINKARYLEMIEGQDGHRTVSGCTRPMVRKMRDRFMDKPGKANNWLSVFRSLMSFAVDNSWRLDNPASGIKPLATGEHEPWPADVLEAALSVASPMMRLAIITGLCSGARVGDVIKMQHGWHDGETMRFITSKNQADVAVPMHPLWIAELGKIQRSSVTILYDRQGKPFSGPKAIQERMRTLMREIGSPTYLSNGKARLYSFHGLRKNAACYLIEAGLNDSEAGSIVGMTPQTVRHYTKRSNVLMIAKGAALRVTKGDVLHLKGGRVAN
jgi:integrase